MKLLAIDGNSILNRAFYGIRPLSNKNGIFTNAVFGFMNIYFKNFNAVNPDCVAVAFDMDKPTFRHQAVATYKANRKGMPPELFQQMPLIKKLLTLMGIKIVEMEGFEADDILGTLAKFFSEKGHECFVLTGDRDSLQLIDDNITVRLATNKDTVIYDTQKFNEDYGFEPVNLIDLKALMGDSSDNIKGVAGIGEKTASSLIKEHKTIEKLYENLESAQLTKSVKAKLQNGKSSAEESKWLATIKCDVISNINPEDYKIGNMNETELYDFLNELEMYKLIEKLNIKESEEIKETPKYEEINPEIINPAVSDDLKNIKHCTYIFDDKTLKIRCENKIYITENTDDILEFLSGNAEKITIGAKSHYKYAFSHGKFLENLVCDIEICGYLLNTSSSQYTVESLCREYNVHYYDDVDNNNISDLLSLQNLSEKLSELIEKENMTFLMKNVENPLIEVLASMEHYGIKVDAEGVKKFGLHLDDLIEDTKKIIYSEAGHEFNILSPKQLSSILFDEMELTPVKKTKNGYSTNADVLEELKIKYPDKKIISSILEYRHYSKLKSTYVDGLLKTISSDNRIHTCFKQTETRTGRISSIEPNMQNIPVRTELGRNMRKFFVAESGKVLIDADYSQIELRVMAHLCGDKNMTEAFVNGEDIHTATASQVFDVLPIMITPEMRSSAKAVNFGIIYGIGAFSLAKDINVSRDEAKKYIDEYLKKYPKVNEFMIKTVDDAEKTGTVSTMFGRKRYVPELKSSNKILKSAGKRIAMNTPVQGSAADLIKIAMINVYKRLKAENLNAHLILQVHDELIVEADKSDMKRASEILKDEMTNAYNLRVPLVVDVNRGNSWYDAKG
ncbi:MAG: DNA polymerase I [Oscillospiraceae bacterium]|nr:DNA polymerase I [Oscillospiraceae bacterium]